MLKIWIVWDDCPEQFGQKRIIRAYMTRKGARKFLKEQKGVAPYENQYWEILPLNVKVE